jgi:hypothetical protein
VPVPYFLLFLCFRKVTRKIFSELDETKAEVSIFSDTRRSPKQRRRGAKGSRTIGWRGPPPGRATRWCGPLVHHLTSPFRLYILLDEKALKARTLQETYCKPPPSSTRDREGPEALPDTLSERGITTGGLTSGKRLLVAHQFRLCVAHMGCATIATPLVKIYQWRISICATHNLPMRGAYCYMRH